MKNTQRYKGRVLNQTRLVKNILAIYDNQEHTGESCWYQTANKLATQLAVKYNVTTLQVSGIIAALSPLKSWDENKKIAEQFLKTGSASHTATMVNKAIAILNYKGDNPRDFIFKTLNGNKIQNFFLNIAFPLEKLGATIDRHAVSVAVGEVLPDSMLRSITDKQYDFFVEAYIRAGKKVNLLPHEVQAVVWVKWRKLKEAKKNEGVPF